MINSPSGGSAGGMASQSITVTLAASGWTQSGDLYSQTVSVPFVSASTPVVIVDVSLSTSDTETNNNVLATWGAIAAFPVTQNEGSLTFYSATAPEINVSVNVGVA